MSEIITLSSDEEDSSIPKKRRKYDNEKYEKSKKVKTGTPPQKSEESSVVILSDEEDKPAVPYEKNKPVISTKEDNTVIIDEEDKPVILDKVDKPVVLDEEDKPVVLDEEDKPVVLDEDKPLLLGKELKKDVTYNKKKELEIGQMDLIEIGDETELSCTKENDCEIIDLEKEDPKKIAEKENVPENPRNNLVSIPAIMSDGTEPTCYSLLHNFLDICEANLKDSLHAEIISKFPNIWKNFKQCESRLANLTPFKKLLVECMKKAQQSSVRAAVCFRDVYVFVKEACTVDEVCVSKENRRKLKKLEKCINLLVKKIKDLENSEVDFDDEADSTYLQLDRYQNRLNKIYNKYCQLLNKDPYSGRLTRAKLVFTNSHFEEINRVISKKYKNNDKFPTYFDIENLIKRVVEDENLKLGESEIKVESALCFRKLGDLLQKRRKTELFDTHYSFIQDTEDPATKDYQLNSTLKESFLQGQEKMDEIYEEFVLKEQTTKDEVSGSHTSDSEDSDKGRKRTDESSPTKESIK